MKKWFLVTVIAIVTAIAGIYIFIPGKLNIVQITPVTCTAPGAYRILTNGQKWQSWLPGKRFDSSTFLFNNTAFTVTKKLRNTLEINITGNDQSLKSTLHIFPVAGDTINLNWSGSFATGLNPFKRIQHYRQALALKNNLDTVLRRFKTFAEKKENIYGISFHETIFRDSFLISSKTFQANYPNVSIIYSQLNKLKQYSTVHQARQTGNPFMNVTPMNPSGYQLMTALPLDRQIPAGEQFFNQRIPMNHFYVIRVQGGNAAVGHAMHQFQLYIQDYQRTVMALPFQQLITDRSAEQDTTRWITDIYYPLF
jgi:hypothetical protein